MKNKKEQSNEEEEKTTQVFKKIYEEYTEKSYNFLLQLTADILNKSTEYVQYALIKTGYLEKDEEIE